MKTFAKGKSIKIEQAGVVFYDCEREALIEKYDIRLVGSFAMPRKEKGKSIMTSMNEHVRMMCKSYLEEFELHFKKAGGEWDLRKVSQDQLHWAVMRILADSIDSVTNAGESLFDIDIYMKKGKEKELENELNGIEKNIKWLNASIEAGHMVEQKMAEILKKNQIDPSIMTQTFDNTVRSVEWVVDAVRVWPTKQINWVVSKPKTKWRGLNINWISFWG